MKFYRSIITVLAAAVFCGCVQETEPNPWGEKENPDNHGVYFPPQTSSTNLQLESHEPAQVTYRVRRSNILEPIIVPVVLSVKAGEEEIANPEEIFKVEPIAFDSGEDEAKFQITFPDAEVGTEYTVNLRVEDPDYISLYGKKNTSISFTVLRANWKNLGKGRWRDDIISSMYSGVANPNAEVEVDIYEREDLPGYYRMQVFNSNYVQALFDQPLSTEDVWTIVDASDNDAVWIPRQSTGIQINSSDGVINIASNVDRIFSMDASENEYGTLEDNIITFPEGGVLVNLPGYSSTGWFSVNTNGLLRIMLPGAREYDYSAKLTKTDPVDGVMKVSVAFGSDVASVRYKIYEGALDDAQASLYAQDLDDGKDAFDGGISASGDIEIKDRASGKYTLVVCTYSAEGDKMRGYEFIPFGYIAAGDDRPVKLTFGLEATEEFAGIGVNTDNSARFYAYGEGIESLKMSIVRTARLEGIDMREYVEKVGVEFSDAELRMVNEGHYSTMLKSLNGGSEYTMILLADNGYNTALLTTTYTTTGTFNPLVESYSYNDFLTTHITKDDFLSKTYSLYGVNLMDEEPEFRRLSTVSISDVTDRDVYTDTEIIDYVLTKGMTGLVFDSEETGILSPFIPGTSGLSLYKGQLGIFAQQSPIGQVGGKDIMCGFVPMEDMNIYMGLGMFAGAVADGYYAFAPNPEAMAQGMTFVYFAAFNSSGIYSMLCDMILVDDSKNPVLPGKAVMESRKEQYRSMKASLSARIPEMVSRKPLVIGENPRFILK